MNHYCTGDRSTRGSWMETRKFTDCFAVLLVGVVSRRAEVSQNNILTFFIVSNVALVGSNVRKLIV